VQNFRFSECLKSILDEIVVRLDEVGSAKISVDDEEEFMVLSSPLNRKEIPISLRGCHVAFMVYSLPLLGKSVLYAIQLVL